MREAEPHEHEEMRESDDLAGEEVRGPPDADTRTGPESLSFISDFSSDHKTLTLTTPYQRMFCKSLTYSLPGVLSSPLPTEVQGKAVALS